MPETRSPTRAWRRLLDVLVVVSLAALTACATPPPPRQLTTTGSFSFADYDHVVVAKPDPVRAPASLYGLDVEFANLMARHGLKVVGDREFPTMRIFDQRRVLLARLSLTGVDGAVQWAVTFDSAESGKALAGITTDAKGPIGDAAVRRKAYDEAASAIVTAIARDKGQPAAAP